MGSRLTSSPSRTRQPPTDPRAILTLVPGLFIKECD